MNKEHAVQTSLLEQRGVDPVRAVFHLAAATHGADDGELFVERIACDSLSFDDGRLRHASCDASEGFGLRVVADAAVGYAQAADISEAAVIRAAETAAQARVGYDGVAAQSPPAPHQLMYADLDPNLHPAFAAKIALLEAIDAYARARDGTCQRL